MKLDKTLDETRKKSHCSGLTFGPGERILSLRRTIKDWRKVVCGSDCVQLDYGHYCPVAHFLCTEL